MYRHPIFMLDWTKYVMLWMNIVYLCLLSRKLFWWHFKEESSKYWFEVVWWFLNAYTDNWFTNIVIGASLSEPHTSELNGGFLYIYIFEYIVIGVSWVSPTLAIWMVDFSYIMAYYRTPYVGMTPKKMTSTLIVHKWHARNVCVRLVKGLHEPYQALSSASMGNGTINFAGEYC